MSETEQIHALESVRLSWAPTPDDVWRSQSNVHVPGMHERVFVDVMSAYSDAEASDDASPLGVVVRGPAGSGKTHLLGQVREEVQGRGGYFFLIRLLDAAGFWRSTLMGMLDDLMRPSGTESDSQLHLLLRRLCEIAGVEQAQRAQIMGDVLIEPGTLDEFVTAVYKVHPRHRRTSQHTLRALVLSIAPDSSLQDLGDAYLQSIDDVDPQEFAAWGIRRAELGHQGIAENISRMLAITGPTVLAIDQIDTLVAQARTGTDKEFADAQEDKVVEQLAHGLMSLRETLPRTASVLSALSSAWELIAARGVAPMPDRFRVTQPLKPIPSSEVGRLLLGRRLAACFHEAGFTPPHPTWPVAAGAFEQAPDFTPRQLLIAVDRHIRHCLELGTASELDTFSDRSGPSGISDLPTARVSELDALDARYAELQVKADLSTALSPGSEDSLIPTLLSAGLTAWIHEHQSSDDSLAQDPPPSGKPALHARLRHTVDTDTDDEEHWCFRAVTSRNARAALARIERAVSTAGLHIDMPRRRLIVIRNDPWPSGAKTEQTIAALHRAGGVQVPLGEHDRRALSALGVLLTENSPALTSWLLARKPAHAIALFASVLPAASVVDEDAALVETSSKTAAGQRQRSIVVGTEASTNGDVNVPLATLRHHMAIFAGSGSGKTVLIRRLVEEAALQGVSSIVLDENNDLALLGSSWPADERTWPPGDEAKATSYFNDTDVVVWTPGTSEGRPLSFASTDDGNGVDPGELLAPTAGKRARVSVINLGGLDSQQKKQAFVLELQAQLGAWIESAPSDDSSLTGLFVMDEAQHLLSSSNSAAADSTLAFAAQAREHGIGLVFATPSPKGIDDRIADMASTQFYGLLNSPSQVEAAQKLAEIMGGSVPDIARLPAGQFYVAVEGAEFRRTVTPLCLTYHPKVSPTVPEVLALART
ncbi:DUF87 domain-containing protein [Rhodococcus sp. G-MC3]|uniref:helicase HerA domain-containing protein n=1 Tax=Rhodococcus sp. G-MC3 TaxID=3046209 RepID=UPI0024BA7B81|nr:DUF87 domain-containing protein [Rhodococcus sp. G-MC3]MDJ0392762.1 DUF87 domain-containing protein [Rhodococcus sp. G-MC3]